MIQARCAPHSFAFAFARSSAAAVLSRLVAFCSRLLRASSLNPNSSSFPVQGKSPQAGRGRQPRPDGLPGPHGRGHPPLPGGPGPRGRGPKAALGAHERHRKSLQQPVRRQAVEEAQGELAVGQAQGRARVQGARTSGTLLRSRWLFRRRSVLRWPRTAKMALHL